MALPASGPLALTDIQTEFGGANPIGMNEYYAGGGLVPAGTSGTYGAVPSSGALSIQNFYGTSNFVPVNVEDVFSTFLYVGSGASQTITNGVNLSANGGLVWGKNRTFADNHYWCDSARGPDYGLYSNSTFAQAAGGGTTFGTTGFTVSSANGYLNANGYPIVSWTFRKQPKFFDIVTYTGDGVTGRNISHNLGAVPGAIIIKNTSSSSNWAFGLATNLSNWSGTSKILCLNTTDQDSAGPTYSNGFINDATSTTFQVVGFSGNQLNVNQSGQTYVAYLFASNAGGFGATGSDNVITCGAFTTSGASAATVTLGYEPQWVMIKSASLDDGYGWLLLDTMRGFTTPEAAQEYYLRAQSAAAESGNSNFGGPTSTGFEITSLQSSSTYIYIAIRRGPMKVPTVGTSVFTPADSGNDSAATDMNFPVDAFWETNWAGSIYNTSTATRLTNNASMLRTSSDAAANGFFSSLFANTRQNFYAGGIWGGGTQVSQYGFRRAPKFMDIVCYVGTGTQQALNHNLTIAPEAIITKRRDSSGYWRVYISPLGVNYYLTLNDDIGVQMFSGVWGATPTSTQFSVGTGVDNNNSGGSFTAYLFATCPGVSKVGSFTGTGSLQTINCGFTTGVRFILIKRTDSTGDWYLYDSVRGISSGNDPYNLLNSSAANVNGTNYVDTTSVGFQVTAAASGTVNVSGGAYIFLAIA